MVMLATPEVRLPAGGARPRTIEDMLTLEAMELSLEHEQLEAMEHQVATTKDALASREAMIQQEVDEKVAGIHDTLAEEYRWKLELQEALFYMRHDELHGKANALKEKLVVAEQWAKAA